MARKNSKILSDAKITIEPEASATSATVVSWIDMRDAYGAGFILGNMDGTAGISAYHFEVAATATGGSSSTLKTVGLTDRNPDAAGSYIVEEVLADEIGEKSDEDGVDYRYLGAKLTASATGGTFAMATVKIPNRFAYDELTDDVIV